jgi:uncharacterized protein YecE (DUF72 family)
MAGTLYLGTSGYAYPEWKGVFYPPEVKVKDQLRYFASRFRSVEINYTFRHQPAETTLASWREQTPEEFLFTLKAHQIITHRRRLKEAQEEVEYFLTRARQLGDRLGVILFQCPPNLPYDADRISSFLDVLPAGGRYAMEFRHASWEEARGQLRERGVAWCTAETDEQAAPTDSWEPFGYLRLRKEEYMDEELAAWAARVRPALDAGHDVFVYFKHEEKGVGPRFAERFEEILAAPESPERSVSAS